MKAVIKPSSGAGLILADLPMPTVGEGDVLIEVKVAAICGSDLPIYDWDDPWVQMKVQPGQIIGHEFCGTIVEVGKQVKTVKVGQLVTAEGHLFCGMCRRCRSGDSHVCPNSKFIGFDYPGAFAEFISVPEKYVRVSDDLPLVVASLQDPFGNAIHAVSAVPVTNSTVLVTGCGPIGLMSIKLARAAGARAIYATDLSDYRCQLAREMGADRALNPSTTDVTTEILNACDDERGVDVLLEMSGDSTALSQGFGLLRGGATAVLLGLPKQPIIFDISTLLITKGITVHGVIGRRIDADWNETQRYLRPNQIGASIDIGRVVTHRLYIDDFEQGFRAMKVGESGKVILLPKPEILGSYGQYDDSAED